MVAMNQVVYLPPTADRPTEPAPYVLTDRDVIRLLQGVATDPYQALYKLRRKGLKAVSPMGKVRYLLPDVIQLLEDLKEIDPR